MIKDFISIFFPNVCCICAMALIKDEFCICFRCKLSFPKTDHIQNKNNALMNRFAGKINLKYAFAYYIFNKEGSVQKLLHELKYRDSPQIGELVGKWIGQELLAHGYDEKLDLIIPIPLHESKERTRGYNQSKHLAMGISESMGIPYSEHAVKRVLKSETQTKKNRIQRWLNVKNIFEIAEPSLIKDRNIFLVDDVITTGSTFEACGLEILKAGAKSLSIGAIAAAK